MHSCHRNPSVCVTLYFQRTLAPQLMGGPRCFSEVDLHVMHIYNAFPTTHRIPTAASSGAAATWECFFSLLLPLAPAPFSTS